VTHLRKMMLENSSVATTRRLPLASTCRSWPTSQAIWQVSRQARPTNFAPTRPTF